MKCLCDLRYKIVNFGRTRLFVFLHILQKPIHLFIVKIFYINLVFGLF